MPYGLEISDNLGNIVLTTNQSGIVLIDTFYLAGTSTAIRTYPDWASHTIVATSVAYGDQAGHQTSVSGVTVTVTKSVFPYPFSQTRGPSYIYVFAK